MTLPALKAMLGAQSSWTPESLPSLVAWWDADDAGSFTFGSGSEVASWASQVGSYSLVQTTSSKRPSRSATVGGRSAVAFGSDDALSVASFDMGAGEKASLWVVAAMPVGGDRVLVEHSPNTNSYAGAFLAYRNGTTNNADCYRRAGSTATWRSTDTWSTTPKAAIFTIDGTLTTDEVSGWLNGSSAGSRPSNNNTSGSNRIDTLYVGARGGTSLYLNGTIAEIGISTAVFAPSEIMALNAYLAAKWSL